MTHFTTFCSADKVESEDELSHVMSYLIRLVLQGVRFIQYDSRPYNWSFIPLSLVAATNQEM